MSIFNFSWDGIIKSFIAPYIFINKKSILKVESPLFLFKIPIFDVVPIIHQ